MRIPNASDIRRLVLQTVQPLSSGLIEVADSFTAKLKDLSAFGSGDQFRLSYPYGMVGKPIQGVIAYLLNLQGKALAPIIIAHLDKKRPVPSAAGEVIFYCLNADGSEVPCKITLGVDGVLKIQTTSKVQVLCDDVEIGNGTLEKVLNGETFQTFFNAHVHEGNLGTPTSPPMTASGGTHLSTKVKAGK
jgi:hypothetical protein